MVVGIILRIIISLRSRIPSGSSVPVYFQILEFVVIMPNKTALSLYLLLPISGDPISSCKYTINKGIYVKEPTTTLHRRGALPSKAIFNIEHCATFWVRNYSTFNFSPRLYVSLANSEWVSAHCIKMSRSIGSCVSFKGIVQVHNKTFSGIVL